MEQEHLPDSNHDNPEIRNATIPSMKRRMKNKDYRERTIYMITLVVAGRRKLFGEIEGDIRSCYGDANYPHIVLTTLGEAVREQILRLPGYYPQLSVSGFQIMPDHVHIIIFVHDQLPCHLGIVIRGLVQGCNKAYHQLYPQDNAVHIGKGKSERRSNGILFEHGYNDKVLMHQNQLKIWRHYLADNPRRLMVKHAHPDYFRVQRNIKEKGLEFSAIGNLFLLRKPLLQIQCSRHLTETEIQEMKEKALIACASGAVLISPCISPGEKAVMRAAFEKDYPEIVLLENGLTDLAKPGGARFDACAKGQLLLLAPWEHHTDKRRITRTQCHILNNMAALLSDGEKL